jgi:hypothetical protein
LGLLSKNQRQLLKLFYTAAVHLQRLYQGDLISIMSSEWVWLPNLFGEDLEISSTLSHQDAIIGGVQLENVPFDAVFDSFRLSHG